MTCTNFYIIIKRLNFAVFAEFERAPKFKTTERRFVYFSNLMVSARDHSG